MVHAAGLTRLELNTIKGPTAIQYDEMLETLTNLEHLQITKVLVLDNICFCHGVGRRGCESLRHSFSLLYLRVPQHEANIA